MATTAQLGVAIDSGPAKKGSEEVKAALKSIGTEARTMATTVETSVGGSAKAVQRGAFALDALGVSSREAAKSVAFLQQANEKSAQAAEKAALAEQREAQAIGQRMAAAEAAAYRMDAAIRTQTAAFGLGEGAAGRFRESLNAVATQALGTSSSATVLTSTLSSLAVGNAATIGILAGVAAIGFGYDAITASAQRTKKATEDAIRALTELETKKRQSATGDLPTQVRTVDNERVRLEKELADARKNLAELRTSPSFAAGKIGDNTTSPLASIAAAEAKIRELQGKIATGQREIVRILNETNKEYSSAQTAQLADLVRNNAATVGEQQKLRDRLKNLQGDLATLTATGGDPAKRQQLVSDTATITAVYDAQGKAAEKAGTQSVKAARETIEGTQRYQDSLASVAKGIAEYDEAEAKKAKRLADGNAAIGESIAAKARDIAVLREQIEALKGNTNAYEELNEQRAIANALAAARAKLPDGAELSDDQVKIITEQAEALARLNAQYKEGKAFKDAYDASFNDVQKKIGAFDAKAARAYTDALVNGLRDALAIATQVANALQANDTGGALLAGASGILQMAGPGGQAAAQALQLADALDLFGRRARERAREMQAAADEFNRALESFAIRPQTNEEAAIARNADRATQIARTNAAPAAGLSFTGSFSNADDIAKEIARLQGAAASGLDRVRKAVEPFIVALQKLEKETRDNEAILRERIATETALATQDLDARAKRAAGLTDEADRIAEATARQRELNAAEEQFGKESEYVKRLKDVQQAEKDAAEAARIAIAAEKERQQLITRTAFSADLTARRQSLSGDDRGAFITRGNIGNASALAQAEELVRAGTITAAMFEELKTILGEELTQAIADFDAAVAKAKQTQQDDLAVRALVAVDMGAQAEALRREIANRNELEGVTDEGLRAQILYVQGLEAVAVATAAAATAAAEYRAKSEDIDRRRLEAIRIVAPALAKEIEAKELEVARAKELAEATDALMRARLEELFALQDQAAAMQRVTEQMENAAKAADALATFTGDLNDQWLRSTGRTFDAEVAQLESWKREQQKIAAQNGLANDPETQQKITDIFNFRYNKLIADQMAATQAASAQAPLVDRSGPLGGASVPREDITTLGENVAVASGARAISEVSAMRLVDYAASQLAVQREILAHLRGGSSRTGGGLASSPSFDLLDRGLGERLTSAALLGEGIAL